MDNFLGFARCDAMESNNLVHCRRGSHDPVRHPGAGGVHRTNKFRMTRGRLFRMMRAAHLRAFVPLCEIHWRSVWFWRGCVLARYGRGPTRLALLLFLGYIVRVTVNLNEISFGVACHLPSSVEKLPALRRTPMSFFGLFNIGNLFPASCRFRY